MTLEEAARERFERDTAEHEMTVRLDNGLYRHLRFQKPGSWTYGFDIVTWPGYLAIVGDAGDYLFARTADMFEFFEGDGERINPDYWGEKLQGPGHDTERRYSEEKFRRRVVEWFEDVSEDMSAHESAALRDAVNEQILNDYDAARTESEAHRALRDFEHDGQVIYDSWEWDLRDFDPRFLWCCWAIAWGIAQYRAAKPVEVPA